MGEWIWYGGWIPSGCLHKLLLIQRMRNVDGDAKQRDDWNWNIYVVLNKRSDAGYPGHHLLLCFEE